MNEPVANAREPHLRFGRYEVLMPIGDDGFVTTSIARVHGPNLGPRMVEVVGVAGALSRETEVRAAFLAEARAAGRIRHTNFVSPTDALLHEGDLFGATEFVLGVRLEELMQAARGSGTPIPLGICARIVLDLLAGLSAVHATILPGTLARPLVHGDVAPSNIVISYRGATRLVHSGLSVAASRIGAIDRRNPRLAYKAPEQLLAGLRAVPIGPGADLFATAVISWEMLTSQRLFDAESDLEIVDKVLHAPLPTDAVPSGRDLPQQVWELVNLALDRRPDRPTTSAADFGDAVEQAFGASAASGEDVALFVDQLLGPAIDSLREALHVRVRDADLSASEHAGADDLSGEVASHTMAAAADRVFPSPGRFGSRAAWPTAMDETKPPSSGRIRGRSVWPVGMGGEVMPASLGRMGSRSAPRVEVEEAAPASAGRMGSRSAPRVGVEEAAPASAGQGAVDRSSAARMSAERGGGASLQPEPTDGAWPPGSHGSDRAEAASDAPAGDASTDGITVRTRPRAPRAIRAVPPSPSGPRLNVGTYLAIGALIGLIAAAGWRWTVVSRSTSTAAVSAPVGAAEARHVDSPESMPAPPASAAPGEPRPRGGATPEPD